MMRRIFSLGSFLGLRARDRPDDHVRAMAKFQMERTRLFARLRREVHDEVVIRAIERVPREIFVPSFSRDVVYEDAALPIGEGQTTSQPLLVAMMISTLAVHGSHTVLEVGTGSGFQAAVLSLLAKHVVTVERLPSLAELAKSNLASQGHRNVEVCLAEEDLGCSQRAPFDRIIVAAAAPYISPRLLSQMAVGGRMVIPVGSRLEQRLNTVDRTPQGYSFHTLGPCRFVPLVGKDAWAERPGQDGDC